KKDGDDTVEKWVAGNAIVEHWKDVDGHEGKSFFYFMPEKKQWKQVWVTDGEGYKEKLSEPVADGIRFSGTVFLPDGKTYQDRTTLTKLPNGDVRQVIESSRDGKVWKIRYDAIYHRNDPIFRLGFAKLNPSRHQKP
ncbi:MAG: hypothetical protein WCG75_06260, partial [Armatimonadota bacterium]